MRDQLNSVLIEEGEKSEIAERLAVELRRPCWPAASPAQGRLACLLRLGRITAFSYNGKIRSVFIATLWPSKGLHQAHE